MGGQPSGTIVMDSQGGLRVQTDISNFDPAAMGNRSYTTGRFYGLFNENVLSVSAPITGNYNTYGYVLIHLPLSQITQSQNDILNILYITSAIVICPLADHPSGIYPDRLPAPAQNHRIGANEYAAGNLEYRINVKTHDEVGYLADTLNYMSDELNKMEEYQKNISLANVSHDFRARP